MNYRDAGGDEEAGNMVDIDFEAHPVLDMWRAASS